MLRHVCQSLLLLAILLYAAPMAHAQTSTFDTNDEGWTGLSFNNLGGDGYNVINTYPVRYDSSGGDPGGFVTIVDPDIGDYTFSAPASYLGNQIGKLGGTLSYELLHNGQLDQANQGADVILLGSDGTKLLWLPATRVQPTEGIWSRFTASISPSSEWKVNLTGGPTATTADFQNVLGNLVGIYIRGEFSGSSAESTGLDNVSFAGPTVTLTVLSVSPGIITGGKSGTGTVTLSGPAPNDISVSLGSTSPSAGVPASVTVTAGSSSADFAVTTTTVAADTPATISATLNADTRTADILVTATALSSLTVSPTSVLGGKKASSTVTLSKLAPAGGFVVSLSSANPNASVPASVTVQAGSKSAKFSITTTLPDNAPVSGNISASFGGTTKTASLTVNPLTPKSLTLTPDTLYGGGKVTGKVTLTGPAPSGGKVVTLSCTNSAATCPASVTVPAGSSGASFTITTVMPTTTQTGNVSATAGGVTISAPLTVMFGIPTKLSIAFSPSQTTYVRGQTITVKATLKDGSGNPLPNETVVLIEVVGSTGARNTLGTLTTNANGQVSLSYTVPTDTSKSSISIETNFAGDGDYEPAPKASKKVNISP